MINKEEIQEALKIIREPITVLQENYKYFDEENYNKLVSVYENCQWFINNWEQIEQNIEDLQKKAELADHYKHLYSEVKKQKDDGIKYIKEHFQDDEGIICKYVGDNYYEVNENFIDELLRMLGETDE